MKDKSEVICAWNKNIYLCRIYIFCVGVSLYISLSFCWQCLTLGGFPLNWQEKGIFIKLPPFHAATLKNFFGGRTSKAASQNLSRDNRIK